MTPEDHNKALGIMHLVYGGFHTVLVPVVAFFVFMGVAGVPADADGILRTMFFLFAFLFSVLFLAYGLVPLLAGFGLLLRKRWGRTLGIVAAVLMSLNIPFGTALAVYSFWFFLGGGKTFYEQGAQGATTWQGALNAPSAGFGWDTQRANRREQDYVPPQQPPDWRG